MNYEAQTDRAVAFHSAALIDGLGDVTKQDRTEALEAAQERAELLSLDDMSKDWCIHSLVEAMPASEMKTVMQLLRTQVAREIVEQGEGV